MYALIQADTENDNEGCVENEGSGVQQCDGDQMCMLMRVSFQIKLTDEGKELLSTCRFVLNHVDFP